MNLSIRLTFPRTILVFSALKGNKRQKMFQVTLNKHFRVQMIFIKLAKNSQESLSGIPKLVQGFMSWNIHYKLLKF